jgi:hypothetical protein
MTWCNKKTKGPVRQAWGLKTWVRPVWRPIYMGQSQQQFTFSFFLFFFFFLYFLQINASSCKPFFKYFLFIFRLIHLFFFIVFREPIWNKKKFIYAFNFLKDFSDSAMIFFYFLYKWNLFLKIKKYIFSDNISNIFSLTFVFPFYFALVQSI